ncbi:MAG: hypothetical protein JW384_04166 [Nitrosomonadaceae bacterium]|nr:hypothetical protein [Nitrosomonadaceae bacterium]
MYLIGYPLLTDTRYLGWYSVGVWILTEVLILIPTVVLLLGYY